MHLSQTMIRALRYLHDRGDHPGLWIGTADPGATFDPVMSNVFPTTNTLLALHRRGLVAFDVRIRITEPGRHEIERHIRRNPGRRDFRVIDNDPD